MTFYNENDRFPAEWIRNLMDKGHISHGRVDERSIAELEPADLDGYTRAHFFAGIAGWDYALRLAGWPDDAPVWTGSCPCQPFSVAGRRRGTNDERHLWPTWFGLIRECRPTVVFGEQVASADGRDWLAAVRADLESVGYAVGAADLCAAGVGAPHIRQRLYFVAYRDHAGQRAGRRAVRHERDDAGWRSANGELAHPGTRERGQGISAPQLAEVPDSVRGFRSDCDGQLGDPESQQARGTGFARQNFWRPCDWLPFRDGKSRPVEPGTFPLAHGVPGRVGRLRSYGNAIVPQVAAEFVKAFCESRLALRGEK